MSNIEKKRQNMLKRKVILEKNRTNKFIVLRKIRDTDRLDLNDSDEEGPFEVVEVIDKSE